MDKNIPINHRIIFALDFDDVKKAKDYVILLEDYTNFFKVGLQLFISQGPDFIRWLTDRGNSVMLDLKLYDIPQTVMLAIREISQLNVKFTTIHCVRQVIDAAKKSKGDLLKVLGVTVLTSMTSDDLVSMGIRDLSIEDVVLMRAKEAMIGGCDGIVASPREVSYLRKHLGDEPIIVTPGVRLSNDNETSDQKRIATPYEAIRNGADYLVVGRPIRDAKDPVRAISDIIDEIKSALAQEC